MSTENISNEEKGNGVLADVISSFLLEFKNKKTKKDEFIAFRFEGNDLVANRVTWIEWNSDDWFEIGRLKNCL